jgi:hypothetical protein
MCRKLDTKLRYVWHTHTYPYLNACRNFCELTVDCVVGEFQKLKLSCCCVGLHTAERERASEREGGRRVGGEGEGGRERDKQNTRKRRNTPPVCVCVRARVSPTHLDKVGTRNLFG